MMFWIYLALVLIAICLTAALVFKSAWMLLCAVIVIMLLTEGWRMFRPKKDPPDA